MMTAGSIEVVVALAVVVSELVDEAGSTSLEHDLVERISLQALRLLSERDRELISLRYGREPDGEADAELLSASPSRWPCTARCSVASGDDGGST